MSDVCRTLKSSSDLLDTLAQSKDDLGVESSFIGLIFELPLSSGLRNWLKSCGVEEAWAYSEDLVTMYCLKGRGACPQVEQAVCYSTIPPVLSSQ